MLGKIDGRRRRGRQRMRWLDGITGSVDKSFSRAILNALSVDYGFSLDTPFQDYPEEIKEKIGQHSSGSQSFQ